jgi:hypothetical protein
MTWVMKMSGMGSRSNVSRYQKDKHRGAPSDHHVLMRNPSIDLTQTKTDEAPHPFSSFHTSRAPSVRQPTDSR